MYLVLGVKWDGRSWRLSVPLAIKANHVGSPAILWASEPTPIVEEPDDTTALLDQDDDRKEDIVSHRQPITSRQEILLSRLVNLERTTDRAVLVTEIDAGCLIADRGGPFGRGDLEQLAERGYIYISLVRAGPNVEVSVTPEGFDYYDQRTGAANVPDVSANEPQKRRTVFVVHGRDKQTRDSLFALLRAAELRPLEWEQAVRLTGHGSPYIGDVIRAGMDAAQAVVVLFTGDDLASLREELLDPGEEPETPKPQPRPNVLFEAGMALGISEKRTILVEVGKLRGLSDVTGRHAVRLDNSEQARRKLLGRLDGAGCSVDWSGEDWMRAGVFQSREPPPPAQVGPRPVQDRPSEQILRYHKIAWMTERDSEPMSIDGGKRILSELGALLLELLPKLESVADSDSVGRLTDVIRKTKTLQKHRVYMDGGVSYFEFWRLGDEAFADAESVLRGE